MKIKLLVGMIVMVLLGVGVLAAINNPPVLIEDISEIIVEEGELYRFDLDNFFYDPDADLLDYDYNNANSFLQVSIDGDNVVTVRALEGWYGSDIIIFNATDGVSFMDSNVISITVTEKDDLYYYIGYKGNITSPEVFSATKSCHVLDMYGNLERCKVTMTVW